MELLTVLLEDGIITQWYWLGTKTVLWRRCLVSSILPQFIL